MAALELNPGEQNLGKWTLFYSPPGGGKFNGNLIVTNQRLLYDAKFDASLMGVLGNVTASGHMQINKGDITNVDVEKKLLHDDVKGAELAATGGIEHLDQI